MQHADEWAGPLGYDIILPLLATILCPPLWLFYHLYMGYYGKVARTTILVNAAQMVGSTGKTRGKVEVVTSNCEFWAQSCIMDVNLVRLIQGDGWSIASIRYGGFNDPGMNRVPYYSQGY